MKRKRDRQTTPKATKVKKRGRIVLVKAPQTREKRLGPP